MLAPPTAQPWPGDFLCEMCGTYLLCEDPHSRCRVLRAGKEVWICTCCEYSLTKRGLLRKHLEEVDGSPRDP